MQDNKKEGHNKGHLWKPETQTETRMNQSTVISQLPLEIYKNNDQWQMTDD